MYAEPDMGENRYAVWKYRSGQLYLVQMNFVRFSRQPAPHLTLVGSGPSSTQCPTYRPRSVTT